MPPFQQDVSSRINKIEITLALLEAKVGTRCVPFPSTTPPTQPTVASSLTVATHTTRVMH